MSTAEEEENAWLGELFQKNWGSQNWELFRGSPCRIRINDTYQTGEFLGIVLDDQDYAEAIVSVASEKYLQRIHPSRIFPRHPTSSKED